MHYDYRNDFPLLMQNKIIYIDNAATSQRPQCVIDAEGDFYWLTATQVPEVSTVASVFGIMALGFALIRRRK